MKEITPDEIYPNSSVPSEKPLTRREFISRLALGGGTLVLLSGCSRWVIPGPGAKAEERIYDFIAVDYTRCTGCRTCEAVCAASNHPLFTDGDFRSDLGNPVMSHIRVHSFNPDVDAPVTCARCDDTPCVNACPVEPDPKTGHRALFQDSRYGTITNDPDRCISCGSCVDACGAESVGILAQHPESGRPMRMCTLCEGDPQCVRHCPYEALSLISVRADQPFYRMSPEAIAQELTKRWYDLTV